MKSQTSLVTLYLSGAYLSASETVDILSWLCQSSNLATLKEIDMTLALDFSEDESCELICQLIDTAPCLTKCDIGQTSRNERRVKVLIEYAVEADPEDDSVVPKQGLIKVVNSRDESKIRCQRQTTRASKRQVEIKQD